MPCRSTLMRGSAVKQRSFAGKGGSSPVYFRLKLPSLSTVLRTSTLPVCRERHCCTRIRTRQMLMITSISCTRTS
eukprot:scaffold88091_cov19-Prasinocladus_malaysianus.AAC.1